MLKLTHWTVADKILEMSIILIQKHKHRSKISGHPVIRDK